MASRGKQRAYNGYAPGCALLDLPVEILSQIAVYLSLDEQIQFLLLHRSLTAITRTAYSPLPTAVRSILLDGPPYPPVLERLPTLSLLVPDDDEQMCIDLLIIPRPKWILERLEFGRWKDSVWREAYERRFLRSWRRYKKEDDTWRSAFLKYFILFDLDMDMELNGRMLGRLEHRFTGCSHEDSWTRFVTLHRSGSASINRIYSRTFDPYDIFAEYKNQNNLASDPTTIRVILHLQDVRIIMVGVIKPRAVLFVNPNAHLAVHPPLLRGLARFNSHDTPLGVLSLPVESASPTPPEPLLERTSSLSQGAVSPSANSNEAYYPLVRSLSPSGPFQTTYGLGDGAGAGPSNFSRSPTSPSLLGSLARALPGAKRRLSSAASETDDRPRGLFRVQSRGESDPSPAATRRRSRSLGNGWSGGEEGGAGSSLPPLQETAHDTLTDSPATLLPLGDIGQSHRQLRQPYAAPGRLSPPRHCSMNPYKPFTKPQPHYSFRSYPNYTPPFYNQVDEHGDQLRGEKRHMYEEMVDDELGRRGRTDESLWGHDGNRMVEWSRQNSCYARWVGPALIMAQLHPSDRIQALPYGANMRHSAEVDGPDVDLGRPGMYADFGYEDLEDLMPWIELKSSGTGGERRRSGLGFE